MTTTTTYEEIYSFLVVSQLWLNKNEKNAGTKLGYAIQKVRVKAEKLYQEYLSKVEDLNIDHCVTDEKGVILKDEKGNYQFTKEGLKKKNAEVRKLAEEQVQIESHFATELPKDLTLAEETALTGFVIREEAAVSA